MGPSDPMQHVPEIIGYVEPWIVSPGDTIEVKISSTEPDYAYRVVRLVQGHEGDHFPRKIEETITDIPTGTQRGRLQLAHPGSYGLVSGFTLHDLKDAVQGIDLFIRFQSHLPQCDHAQTIVSTLNHSTNSGFAIALTETGAVELRVGIGSSIKRIPTTFCARRHEWVEAVLSIRDFQQAIDFKLTPLASFANKPSQAPFMLKNHRLSAGAHLFEAMPLLLAADLSCTSPKSSPVVVDFFDGRISSLTVTACMNDGTTHSRAEYDFSLGISGDRFYDKSANKLDGVLVNGPSRAVTDHSWDGAEADWTKAECGYGAIHFHEDDLDDAGWETDFSVCIPETARSGAYAVKVTATNGSACDDVTFFVRPLLDTASKTGVKVAFVLSTFTYLAYGNERMYDQSKASRMHAPNAAFEIRKDAQFYRMERRTDLGLSTYDVHKDESGVVHSSPRRPLLAVRPDYINWAMWRPREFSADLLMIAYLEHLKIPYDVITDHDLHFSQQEDSASTIQQYRVLITGCHPEYHTLESLEAYMSFARSGGSLMYLGGNGFYWTAALKKAESPMTMSKFSARLEVRRGDQGVRSYTLPGGELHFSTNGQRGALWRSRGRSPNTLFGVGSAGEGTGPGVAFERTEASRSDEYKWVFEGIRTDVFGIDGFGGGASGDEIDKYDVRNGSPLEAVVLATSIGHSDEFGIFPEDAGFPLNDLRGSQTREIRSDMVYYATGSGGHVFSVGSINWFCSLGWDGFDNDIARLTSNVLNQFLKQYT